MSKQSPSLRIESLPEYQQAVNAIAPRLSKLGVGTELVTSPDAALEVPNCLGDKLAESGYATIEAGQPIEGLLLVLYAEFVRSVRAAARRDAFTDHPDFEDYVPHALCDLLTQPLTSPLDDGAMLVRDAARTLCSRLGLQVRRPTMVRHGAWDHPVLREAA